MIGKTGPCLFKPDDCCNILFFAELKKCVTNLCYCPRFSPVKRFEEIAVMLSPLERPDADAERFCYLLLGESEAAEAPDFVEVNLDRLPVRHYSR